jgi:hypothetical protein
MTAYWMSSYVRTEDRAGLEAALVAALVEQGYQRFDPFPGGTGTPPGIKDIVRLFVAPAQAAWVRIVGALPAEISLPLPHLRGWIVDAQPGWEAYRDGHPDPDGLLAYVRPGVSAADVIRAMQVAGTQVAGTAATHSTTSPLPSDLETLARQQGVNPQHASKLIGRLTAQVFGKLDRQSGGEAGTLRGEAQAAVNHALSGGERVVWSSLAAQRLSAAADLLTLPTSWREPELGALREAYQVARRVQRNPKAALLPDEKEALQAVPNAIEFTPVYVGK